MLPLHFRRRKRPFRTSTAADQAQGRVMLGLVAIAIALYALGSLTNSWAWLSPEHQGIARLALLPALIAVATVTTVIWGKWRNRRGPPN